MDRSNGDLFVVWQDYRRGEYDIQIRKSTDGGKFWTQFGPVNPSGADFYEPAVDVGSNHQVAVSFYRSDRVPNENQTPTGAHGFQPGNPGVQDPHNTTIYILAGGDGTRAVGQQLTNVRLSPSTPPPDGEQTGFNGDYSGLAVIGSTAHPVWSDTRNAAVLTQPRQGVVHDEDVFTVSVPIP
jgi:hypothetical protein